jgi:hypothetical protein
VHGLLIPPNQKALGVFFVSFVLLVPFVVGRRPVSPLALYSSAKPE